MAITWTEYENTNSYERPVKRTWTTHEGLVVGGPHRREAHPMSDVYCDESYAVVWNPAKGTTETISLGLHCELCTTFGKSEVDASPAVHAEVQRQQDKAEKARLEASRARLEASRAHSAKLAREAAEREFHRPEKGKVMMVVRGRKVAKGTVGRVFWLDNPRNPTRVGLALSNRKVDGRYADVAWVDAAYLENTDPAGPAYAGAAA